MAGLFAAVETQRVRLIARVKIALVGGLADILCPHFTGAPKLMCADEQGLRLWCRRCKTEHLLRWGRLRQVESELRGGNHTSGEEPASCPLDT